MRLRPRSCVGERRLASSGVNRVQLVGQTGELVPDAFLLPALHFHRAGKNSHAVGSRKPSPRNVDIAMETVVFRMLLCISMRGGKRVCRGEQIIMRQAPENIKHVYSQTAESPRKGGRAQTQFPFPVCQRLFIWKYLLKSQRCRSLLTNIDARAASDGAVQTFPGQSSADRPQQAGPGRRGNRRNIFRLVFDGPSRHRRGDQVFTAQSPRRFLRN